jgi:hypothetical protein
MPGIDISQIGSLPAVDPAVLPPEVRNGTAEDRKLYTAALAFERLLVEKITSELADSGSLLGDDEDNEDEDGGSGSSSSVLQERLPGLLADSLATGGGLGVAAEIYRAVKASEPSTDPATEETP